MGPRGALIAACTCNAMGQLTVFTDQAAWTLAVNGAGFSAIEGTFDGVTILNMQPGMVYDVNGDFSITVEGALGSSGDAFIDGGVFHGEIFTATSTSRTVMISEAILLRSVSSTTVPCPVQVSRFRLAWARWTSLMTAGSTGLRMGFSGS